MPNKNEKLSPDEKVNRQFWIDWCIRRDYLILEEILHWKDKADTTPELLLSSHHAKSDECAEIMRNYMESFNKAKQVLKGDN